MSDEIAPFTVEVPETVLIDLRERLARTRFPDQIEGSGWSYGTDLGYLRELCDYWRTSFDWRKTEAQLNLLNNFTTEIGGQNLHFIHARSRRSDALPLLLCHGWPGSVLEFLKVLPPLTDPEAHGGEADDAFHVICPSMPGYGFSGPTRDEGWDAQRVAEAFIELMRLLGYERYGAQGGDWGALVTGQIGRLDPQHCAGIHLNMVLGLPQDTEGLTDLEQRWVDEVREFQKHETGYQQIQRTKPQTLAYGLTDSPAGLAAWIVEKFRTWSDCGGDVEKKFTKDELLSNITLYWVTETLNSSIRLYCEVRRSNRLGVNQGRVEVPTGCVVFPKEIYKAPRRWAEAHFNVTHWTLMPRGGHFAAMEEPELFVRDVREFFRTVR